MTMTEIRYHYGQIQIHKYATENLIIHQGFVLQGDFSVKLKTLVTFK